MTNTTEQKTDKYELKKNRRGQWDIYKNGKLFEGGFFEKAAALEALEDLVR